jgi:hypothetical protein
VPKEGRGRLSGNRPHFKDGRGFYPLFQVPGGGEGVNTPSGFDNTAFASMGHAAFGESWARLKLVRHTRQRNWLQHAHAAQKISFCK